MTPADLRILAQLPKVIAVLRKLSQEGAELQRLLGGLGQPLPFVTGMSVAPEPPPPAIVTPPISQPEPPELHNPLVRRDVGGDWNGGGGIGGVPAAPPADPNEVAAMRARRKADQEAFLAAARAARPPRTQEDEDAGPALPPISQRLSTVSGS